MTVEFVENFKKKIKVHVTDNKKNVYDIGTIVANNKGIFFEDVDIETLEIILDKMKELEFQRNTDYETKWQDKVIKREAEKESTGLIIKDREVFIRDLLKHKDIGPVVVVGMIDSHLGVVRKYPLMSGGPTEYIHVDEFDWY